MLGPAKRLLDAVDQQLISEALAALQGDLSALPVARQQLGQGTAAQAARSVGQNGSGPQGEVEVCIIGQTVSGLRANLFAKGFGIDITGEQILEFAGWIVGRGAFVRFEQVGEFAQFAAHGAVGQLEDALSRRQGTQRRRVLGLLKPGTVLDSPRQGRLGVGIALHQCPQSGLELVQTVT